MRSLPSDIGNLESCLLLNLSQNNLTGEIPISISNMKNIELLLLWDNELNGEIPKNIIELENLKVFDVAKNNLSGNIPDFSENIKISYAENKFVIETIDEEKGDKHTSDNYDDAESNKIFQETKDMQIKNPILTESTNFPKYSFNNSKPYIFGYSDKTIRPNNFITRAEFASILGRIIIHDETFDYSKIKKYADLEKSSWSYNNINFVILNDIMIGNTNKFRPNDNLTRAEFAKIMCIINELDIETGQYFDDVSDGWAKDYIYTVYRNGLMIGNEKKFRPNDYITRSEVIKVINNTINMPDLNENNLENPFIDLNVDNWNYKEILKASVER